MVGEIEEPAEAVFVREVVGTADFGAAKTPVTHVPGSRGGTSHADARGYVGSVWAIPAGSPAVGPARLWNDSRLPRSSSTE